jgi:hypothetical protein
VFSLRYGLNFFRLVYISIINMFCCRVVITRSGKESRSIVCPGFCSQYIVDFVAERLAFVMYF